MGNSIQPAQIEWNHSGMPVASQFDDVYFSNHDGLAETRYVFLSQNGIPQRWHQHPRRHFTIAESGFGSGLNFLATWQAFDQLYQSTPNPRLQQLHFISFEKYPLSRSDLKRTLSHWPELADYAQSLVERYPEVIEAGCQRLKFAGGRIILDLWLGDIQDSLAQLHIPKEGLVDSWFLDGFAPSKNPEMWSEPLFEAMVAMGQTNATFATFTAAGFVRRGLQAAGFEVTKVKGYGTKREMLVGTLPLHNDESSEQPWTLRPSPAEPGVVGIVGAGIAGASLAYALTKRGVKVKLFETEAHPASGASGNRQGAIYPLLNPIHDPLSQFFLQAFCFNRQLLSELTCQGHQISHQWCGLVQLGYDEKSIEKLNRLAKRRWAPNLVHAIDANQASAQLGLPTEHGGLYYPQAGWASPGELVQALLAEAQASGLASIHYQHSLTAFHATSEGVTLNFADGFHDETVNQLVLCNGHQTNQLAGLQTLPLTPVRGQVTHLCSNSALNQLESVLCYDGYLTPAQQGSHCIGATYERNQTACDIRAEDTVANLKALSQCLAQDWTKQLKPDESIGRAAVRCTVRDHLPLAGALPNTALLDHYPLLNHAQQRRTAPAHPTLPNCYCITGLGSRGVCSGPLLAELLAAQLLSEPLPVPQAVLDGLAPNRFWIRKLLKGKRPSL